MNHKECECVDKDRSQWARVTPSVYSHEGKELLMAHSEYIGLWVCFMCGGVTREEPEIFDSVTGECVMKRLVELGCIEPVAAIDG